MKNILISFLMITSLEVSAQVLLSENRFDAEGIDRIEVEGSFCNVHLRPVQGSAVKFEGWIKGPSRYKGAIEIKSSLKGRTLVIYVERPNSLRGNFNGEFRIGIPNNTEVEAINSSGNLYADGLQGQQIFLKCSSGNLRVTDITGNVSLKTSSGNITVDGVEGNMSTYSSSGSQKLEDLTGNLNAISSSGKIYMYYMKSADITAESSSGGVSLTGVTAKIHIESTSGSISGEDVRLTGDSYLETSSGSMNIEFDNDIYDMSFDLRSSSGGLRIGNKRSDDRLVIKRGGIQLTARSSSGSQNFYN